jgi:hypothetical protein
MELKQIIENTKSVYMSETSLDSLLDMERVLDELNVYSYKNWFDGELVEGPVFERYFVGAKFMWPYNKMPDPQLVERLAPYGIEVNYIREQLVYPVEIKSPDDYRGDGSRKGKLEEQPIWIVEIVMPKKLLQDIENGKKQINDQLIDGQDLQSAVEDDLNNPKGMDNDSSI